jgi:siroheme synthase
VDVACATASAFATSITTAAVAAGVDAIGDAISVSIGVAADVTPCAILQRANNVHGCVVKGKLSKANEIAHCAM